MPSRPVPAGARPRLRSGRSRFTKLVIVLVVLAALFEAADLVARHVAQDTIASRAVTASGATSAAATISGWPILYDFFADRSVPGVTVTMSTVPIGQLEVQQIRVTLSDVAVDTGDLVSRGAVKLTGIAQAEVTAVVTATELSQAIGHAVQIMGNGTVEVETNAGEVAAEVHLLSGHVLVVDEGTTEILRVDLATDRLVPKCAMTMAFSSGQVTATCVVAPVPASILAALSGAA